MANKLQITQVMTLMRRFDRASTDFIATDDYDADGSGRALSKDEVMTSEPSVQRRGRREARQKPSLLSQLVVIKKKPGDFRRVLHKFTSAH